MESRPISDAQVLQNIIRLRHSVFDRSSSKNSHIYPALLSIDNGAFYFAQRIDRLGGAIQAGLGLEALREVFVIVDLSKGEVSFRLVDEENRPFSFETLAPLAQKVAQETLLILNEEGGHATTEKEVFDHLLLGRGELSQDIPGWKGGVDRIEAEALLKGQSIGTFLLRKEDELIFLLEESFDFSGQKILDACILSVVETEEKVSERLILHMEQGWILYADEPDLSLYTPAPSLEHLMFSLSMVAKYPLR